MSEKTIIACGNCNKLNAIPNERIQDHPKCGACGEKVFTGMPVEVNQQNFTNLVLKSGIPVVIDFWAPWCGPCQSFAPVFAEKAKVWEPKIRFLKINTEANQALGSQFQIRSIPTLALFKNGQEVTRQAGAIPGQMLDQWLNTNLA